MIDSHCHLDFPEIKKNFNKIIQNSKKNNLKIILTINTDPRVFEEHLNLINDYENIYISYGLHPCNINSTSNFSVEHILSICKNKKVIAIGETGLDFYHSVDFKDKQVEIFENHINSSVINKLPLIVHQRKSEKEIIDVLNNYKNNLSIPMVFHCFTGSEKLLNFCIENNYYISLSGIVTFKNANKLRDIIKEVPLDKLLIETDSPFLAPVPMRGKINEPSFVKYTYQFLSNFFKIPIDDFIKLTDNNFYKLFSKVKKI